MRKKLSLLICGALIALDQFIKVWAITALGPPTGRRITVIPGLFYFTYVENRGAAFGLFQGGTRILGIISLVVLLILLYYLLSNRVKESVLIWGLSLILAGGFGNLIDRFYRGFVVDYLDFSALFGFPVFNFADCCVVCGTGILFVAILVLEKRNQTPRTDEANPERMEDRSDHHEEA
ncbi:MAG: signal peptidase II [Oscillospiraceae bacterium]|jgi:signal peptidase II